jgi:hypothetical protein
MNETIDAPELEQPQIMNVKIVNRNDFNISDRFDGVPYVFESNRPISLPIDAANHIFGWFPGADPVAVRRHMQKRFGWNTPDMVREGQNERFVDAIEITPILYRMVPVEIDEEGEPVSPSKRAPKVNRMMAAVDDAARA